MLIIQDAFPAIMACLLAMFCWGSWSNTQKLVTTQAPVAYFYRDYVLGIGLTALVLAFTVGNLDRPGRSFLTDLHQADTGKLLLALAAGILFNVGNRLLVTGIQLAGMAVAMPLGTGLALVLGLVVNYLAKPEGKPVLLLLGGASVLLAMGFGALAYRSKDKQQGFNKRGLVIVLLAGLLNGFFFRLITSTIAPDLVHPAPGWLSPFTAFVLFALGMLLNNWPLEKLVHRFVPEEENGQLPDVQYSEVSVRLHLYGLFGGIIWGIGMGALLLASQPAGSAISFGLSQGATIVAVLYGVFLWKEFSGAPPETNRWLWLMSGAYLVGISLIVVARLGTDS